VWETNTKGTQAGTSKKNSEIKSLLAEKHPYIGSQMIRNLLKRTIYSQMWTEICYKECVHKRELESATKNVFTKWNWNLLQGMCSQKGTGTCYKGCVHKRELEPATRDLFTKVNWNLLHGMCSQKGTKNCASLSLVPADGSLGCW
jgi:hypothetical protein